VAREFYPLIREVAEPGLLANAACQPEALSLRRAIAGCGHDEFRDLFSLQESDLADRRRVHGHGLKATGSAGEECPVLERLDGEARRSG
jgi:hypothetical protein